MDRKRVVGVSVHPFSRKVECGALFSLSSLYGLQVFSLFVD